MNSRRHPAATGAPAKFGDFGGIGTGAESDKIGDNTKELKRLNDNLYQLLHPEAMQGIGSTARTAMDGAASSTATSAPSVGGSPGLSFGGINFGGMTSFGGGFLGRLLPGLNIPHLASGGIINKPTIALIGERGPEAVVPLHTTGGGAGSGMVSSSHTSIRAFQFGGIVNSPTLALIGEAGPEAIVPLSHQSSAAGPRHISGASGFGAGGPQHISGASGYGSTEANYPASGNFGSNIIAMHGEDGRAGRAGMAGSGADASSSFLARGGSRYSLADNSRSALEYHSHLALLHARDVMDADANETQRVNAAGHIKVQVGNGGVPSASDTLFKPVPEQSLVQMTPAHKGIPERSKSAPPTFAAR